MLDKAHYFDDAGKNVHVKHVAAHVPANIIKCYLCLFVCI